MHTLLSHIAQTAIHQSSFPDSFYHGETHWRGVADQALWLAETLQWKRERRISLFIFGAVHDCQRINDDHDPEHGERASAWLQENFPGLSDTIGFANWTDILLALDRHDKGQTTSCPIIGACWDADRSLLSRVGITPNPVFFSLAEDEGVFDAFILRGEHVSANPASWDALIARALA